MGLKELEQIGAKTMVSRQAGREREREREREKDRDSRLWDGFQGSMEG